MKLNIISDIKVLKKLLDFVSKKKLMACVFFICIIVSLQMTFPIISQKIIDIALLKENKIKDITIFGIILLSLMLFRNIIVFIQNYILIKIANKFVFTLRVHLFNHVQKMNLADVFKLKVGYLLSRTVDDVNILEPFISDSLFYSIQSIFLFLASFFIAFKINKNISFLSILVLVLYLIILIIFKREIKKKGIIVREHFADTQKEQQEYYSNIPVTKSYNAEKYITIKFINIIKKYIKKKADYNIYSTISGLAPLIVSWSVNILVLWFGCIAINKGTATIGYIIALRVYVDYLFSSSQGLYNLVINLQPTIIAAERVFNILEVKEENYTKGNNYKLTKGSIEFKNIAFKYDEHALILDDVNLEIKTGEKIAFVGYSGCGKTTLLSLINKYNMPIRGEILINDININDIKIFTIRNHISYVTQDTLLFSDTIIENIRLGNRNVSEKEIYDIGELVGIDKFIDKLPKGYNSLIGERGYNLSGGQKQCISIARALIKKPIILILDEATSQLDSESEKHIQSNILKYFSDCTMLMVAHRISTITSADRIVVIDKGKVESSGKHNELLIKSNLYNNLCKKQLINS